EDCADVAWVGDAFRFGAGGDVVGEGGDGFCDVGGRGVSAAFGGDSGSADWVVSEGKLRGGRAGGGDCGESADDVVWPSGGAEIGDGVGALRVLRGERDGARNRYGRA